MDTMQRNVEQMRALSRQLARYSYPRVGGEFEEDISTLKLREMHADGYPVIVYLSRSDYADQILETFQISGQRTSFLPFYLVFKMARKFLGEGNLSFLEMYAENKKIYCWTKATDHEGNPIPPQEDFRKCSFEGREYAHMDPSQVNFF